MTAWGLKAHVPMSDFMWSRYKDRTLRVKMSMHPHDFDRGGQVYDRNYSEPDGTRGALQGKYQSVTDESGKYSCECYKADIHGPTEWTDAEYMVDLPIVHQDDIWNHNAPWFEIKPKFGFGFYTPGKWPLAQYGNASECFAMCVVTFGAGSYNPLLDIDPMTMPITEEFDITN
jgi:hypothetical protein